MIIFLDASFLISLFNEDDSNYQKAIKIAKKIEEKNIKTATSNIVLAECVNVIFKKKGPNLAAKFRHIFDNVGIEEYFVGKEIYKKAEILLFKQKSKALNYFDCLHVETMRDFKIDAMATFDREFVKEVKVFL